VLSDPLCRFARVVNLSVQTQSVLAVFLESPGRTRYGLEISREIGLASGTIYPILARLERIGWLLSEWEQIDPAAEGRPPRRRYRLTATGEVAARASVENTLRRFSRVAAAWGYAT
jgi:PadR family transcriptional regulator PadR